MLNKPIEYYNRYTQKIEIEKVYGEGLIKWAYTTKTGSFFIDFFTKSPWISKFYGFLMNRKSSRKKIIPFIQEFGLNSSEFEKAPQNFYSFNDFFYRKLKPSARPIDQTTEHAVFPADGRHFGFQNISSIDGIFVKGQKFNLNSLLGSSSMAKEYMDGSLLLSRLCPVDYHRFHFPVRGKPSAVETINGPLHSVNPLALRRNINILSENRRMLTRIESDKFGPVLMIEVGAVFVGSIIQSYTADKNVLKGEEKGYFKFGGSSTILLFKKNRILLAEDLIKQTLQNRELYAKMGDFLGTTPN